MKFKTTLIVGGMLILIGEAACTRAPTQRHIRMQNETCPVTGNRVNDSDTYMHNGKEYRLCSDQCKQSLSDNPDKYLSE